MILVSMLPQWLSKHSSHSTSVVDPDPYWIRIQDPDPNSMYLDPQHCILLRFSLLVLDPPYRTPTFTLELRGAVKFKPEYAHTSSRGTVSKILHNN